MSRTSTGDLGGAEEDESEGNFPPAPGAELERRLFTASFESRRKAFRLFLCLKESQIGVGRVRLGSIQCSQIMNSIRVKVLG